MRVADSTAYRNLTDHLNLLNDRLETAAREVSTGKKINRPQDSPAESAECIQLGFQLNRIDQYRENLDNSGFFLRVSESSLNEVHNLVTAIFARGSDAANNFNSPEVLETLAAEVRALRDQILSLANTNVRGRYIFAGTQTARPAFSIAGDSVSYQGDDRINTVNVSDGMQVAQNIPGSNAFGRIFDQVEQLLADIEGGDAAAVQATLEGFQDAFAELGTVRTRLGVEIGKLESSELQLQNQETGIRTRKARIEDADMADSITRLNQAQAALEATLKAGSLVRRQNLLDFLG